MSLPKNAADPPEVRIHVAGLDGGGGHPDGRADRLGDQPRRVALLCDRVHHGCRLRGVEREPHQAGGVAAVDGGPAVRSVADVARDALLARDAREDGREAVVALAVDGGGEAQRHRPDAAVRSVEGQNFDASARRVRPAERARVVLGRDPPGRDQRDSGGEQERLAGPLQRVEEGLHDGALRRPGGGEVAEVVLEGQVDDRVGRRRGGVQRPEVVEVARDRCDSGGAQPVGRPLVPRQSGDLMSRGEKFRDDGGPDPARRSCDEYAHVCVPLPSDVSH